MEASKKSKGTFKGNELNETLYKKDRARKRVEGLTLKDTTSREKIDCRSNTGGSAFRKVWKESLLRG